MPAVLSRKEKQIVNLLHHQASLLITMPFEPKLTGVRQLEQHLRLVIKRAERLLSTVYLKDDVKMLMNRVGLLVKTLNYDSFKKSVVALVCRSSHQILYLDMSVEEQVSINNTLEVRDLLRMKQSSVKYLVIILNNSWAKTYLGDDIEIKLIKADSPRPFHNSNDSPIPNIEGKEKIVDGSLYKQICNDFSLISAAYQLPVFVIGSVMNVNRFCHLVKSRKEIIQVMYSDTDNITERQIYQGIEPYLSNWNFIRQRYLRRQLEEASKSHLVYSGITDIIKAIKQSTCKLLMVEEGLIYADPVKAVQEMISTGQEVPQTAGAENHLDLIVQQVLDNGAEVEVVPDGMLKDYDRLAMIIDCPKETSGSSRSSQRLTIYDRSAM